MENNIDILNELRAISPFMAGINKVNVFTLPAEYFEGLSERCLVLARAREKGMLEDLPRQYKQEVPAGYFDQLPDIIMKRIKGQQEETASEELRILSPMLYAIQNENVFEVPKDYLPVCLIVS